MVLSCPKCDARLQLDDSRTPAHPFTVRCPKCQTSVNVQRSNESSAELPAEQPSASPAPGPPTSVATFERPATAERFKPREENAGAANEATPGLADIARLLAEALSHSGDHPVGSRKRAAWDRRKVLVCSSPAYREAIAESLANNDYEVFVADNTAQGLGRMREETMDVVILDANFDPVEQGVAFITREVRLLRPSERRRLFFVSLTSGVRTMDLHAAFLHNVNLVVNPSDLEQLPEALEVSIRLFNELYKPYTRALDLAPI